MATEEYYSFEDVLRDLEIGEEELKRMVSEGELRAFRDENKMKFRKDDVDNLRKGRTTEPTLILPASDQEPVPSGEAAGSDASETVLDLDAAPVDEAGPALDLPDAEAAKRREAQGAGGQVDFSDTDITVADEMPVEVSDAAQETGVEDGTTTEPLQLVEEGATEPVPTEEEAQPVAVGAVPAPSRRRRTIEITEADEEAIESRRPHWIWSILLILSFVAAGYSGFFLYDLLRIASGKASKPSGLTEGLTKKFSDSYYADAEWKGRVLSKTYPPNTLPAPFKLKPAWMFRPEEMTDALQGVPVYGPNGSMQEGSGTPTGPDAGAPAPATGAPAPPTGTPPPEKPPDTGGAAPPAPKQP